MLQFSYSLLSKIKLFEIILIVCSFPHAENLLYLYLSNRLFYQESFHERLSAMYSNQHKLHVIQILLQNTFSHEIISLAQMGSKKCQYYRVYQADHFSGGGGLMYCRLCIILSQVSAVEVVS